MKKMRKTAILTALTLLVGANALPLRTCAFDFVTDNALTAFNSEETVYVRINYTYDNSIRENLWENCEKEAREITDKFFADLDVSNYREALLNLNDPTIKFSFDPDRKPNQIELDCCKESFFYHKRYQTIERKNAEQSKEQGDLILAQIGAVPDENTSYALHYVWSNITKEQLEKAKSVKNISTISVADDWAGENNEQYIGTPKYSDDDKAINTRVTARSEVNTTFTTPVTTHAPIEDEGYIDTRVAAVTTPSSPVERFAGDANLDGKVTIADAVAILQHIGNNDKYCLSAQGKINAEVDGSSGITGGDALMIQKVDAGLIQPNELQTL